MGYDTDGVGSSFTQERSRVRRRRTVRQNTSLLILQLATRTTISKSVLSFSQLGFNVIKSISAMCVFAAAAAAAAAARPKDMPIFSPLPCRRRTLLLSSALSSGRGQVFIIVFPFSRSFFLCSALLLFRQPHHVSHSSIRAQVHLVGIQEHTKRRVYHRQRIWNRGVPVSVSVYILGLMQFIT
jgi:hypothetical protein